MSELKPCPFCGKAGEITEWTHVYIGTTYKPHCSNSSCLLRVIDADFRTKEGAIKAWNRRCEE